MGVAVLTMNVAVIGAGAAGLCCARHLSRSPDVFRFSVYEQTDQVGGTWVYSDRTDSDKFGLPVHSSMYQGLTTNLPKEVMLFPGFPFKKDLPSFVQHTDVLDYLQQYCAHYDLHRYIQFRTLVERVQPVPVQTIKPNTERESKPQCGLLQDSVRWKLTSRNVETGVTKETLYDAILVCNGHFFEPQTPDINGLDNFPGPVLHSHLYRTSDAFTNKKVLIVGSGPSGIDITITLAPHATAVYLAYHRNPASCKLPPNAEQFPPVMKVDPDGTVQFENKVSRQCDAIILCTGYRYTFPFLTAESGVRVEAGQCVTPLFKHTFNAVHPSMAFVGINFTVAPFPYFDIQTRFILSMLSGRAQLPSSKEMIQESEDDYKWRQKQGMPHHHAHRLGTIQFDFYRELAQLGGIEPLDTMYDLLYFATAKDRKNDTLNYKKYNYTVKREGGELTYLRSFSPGNTLQ